jgi:hypothetical protein
MSKGSSTPAPQTTNTVQSTIPAQLLPYATDILNQSEALANQPYVPYGGQQLANTTANTKQAENAAAGLGQVGSQNTQAGQKSLQSGANTAMGLQDQSTSNIKAPQLQNYQMQGAGPVASQSWTTPGMAQQYMNPYEQTALQSQIQIANQQFGQQQNQRNSAAVQNGAYGGDRAALVNQQALTDYNNSTNAMVQQGLGNAYTTGQSAFQAGNSASLLAQEANQQTGEATQNANLQSALSTQQLGAGQQLTAEQANAANQLQAQSQQLQAAQAAGQIGTQQGQLGLTQNQIAQNGINAQFAAGQAQQNQQQAGLNIAYNNFINQQQYQQQQLNNVSGILHGFNPSPTASTVTSSAYTNPVGQLIGAGTGLAGIASALGSTGVTQ